MEENKDIVDLILGIRSENDRKSTLQLALMQARKIIGKKGGELITKQSIQRRRQDNNGHFVNKNNGDIKELGDNLIEEIIVETQKTIGEEEMDILTSLSLYLIVLDQLGHIFGKRKRKSNRIKDALDIGVCTIYKTDNDSEKEAIANLRNSINHNFGLACITPSSKSNKGKEKYTLDIGKDDGKHNPVSPL